MGLLGMFLAGFAGATTVGGIKCVVWLCTEWAWQSRTERAAYFAFVAIWLGSALAALCLL